MSLQNEISRIVCKIDSLHINDPAITKYWVEMAEVLTVDEQATLEFLRNLEEPNVIDHVSSVFEEISIALKSQEFIVVIEELQRQYPQLLLKHMIAAAREVLDDE